MLTLLNTNIQYIIQKKTTIIKKCDKLTCFEGTKVATRPVCKQKEKNMFGMRKRIKQTWKNKDKK